MTTKIIADYLVVGAGATGMAFTDTLVAESDASVVIIDRRHAPGGHWLDAYPFARLHQPSAVYGVASTPLGAGGSDPDSPDEDFGERASASEIVTYYDEVLRHKLVPTGQVNFFGNTEYLGGGRLRSLLTGEELVVDAGKIVDATRMQSQVPATTPPDFDIEDGVAWIPVGDLARVSEPPEGYVIIGAGKTAQDACVWLLRNGVDPTAITWIRARDPWLFPRRFFQPGRGVRDTLDGFARSVEVAASAATADDLLLVLEQEGLLLRIDETVEPGSYRGAIISDRELAQMRRIANVVRLGYVRRIGRYRIMLDEGTIPTGPGRLHVHCAASGLSKAPETPIFAGDRIVPQQVKFGMVPLCAALVAHVEATRDDEQEKNRLCRPVRMPDAATDWLVMTLRSMKADYLHNRDADMVQWLDGCRLNITAGLRGVAQDPEIRASVKRFTTHAAPAVKNLAALLSHAA